MITVSRLEEVRDKRRELFNHPSTGRSPWFNSGASYMNQAFKKKYFDIVSLESMFKRVLAVR